MAFELSVNQTHLYWAGEAVDAFGLRSRHPTAQHRTHASVLAACLLHEGDAAFFRTLPADDFWRRDAWLHVWFLSTDAEDMLLVAPPCAAFESKAVFFDERLHDGRLLLPWAESGSALVCER